MPAELEPMPEQKPQGNPLEQVQHMSERPQPFLRTTIRAQSALADALVAEWGTTVRSPSQRLKFWTSVHARQFEEFARRDHNGERDILSEVEAHAVKLETEFRTRFPQVLFSDIHPASNARMDSPSFPFYFSLGEFRYGSLGFDIGIAGIEKFLEATSGNIDIWESILRMVLPDAFRNIVSRSGFVSDYDLEVDVDASSLRSFVATGGNVAPPVTKTVVPSGSPAPPSSTRVADLLLAVLRGSPFLLPTMMAMGIMYVLFTAVAQRQAGLQSQQAELEKQRQSFFEAQLKTLADANLALEAHRAEVAKNEAALIQSRTQVFDDLERGVIARILTPTNTSQASR